MSVECYNNFVFLKQCCKVLRVYLIEVFFISQIYLRLK